MPLLPRIENTPVTPSPVNLFGKIQWESCSSQSHSFIIKSAVAIEFWLEWQASTWSWLWLWSDCHPEQQESYNYQAWHTITTNEIDDILNFRSFGAKGCDCIDRLHRFLLLLLVCAIWIIHFRFLWLVLSNNFAVKDRDMSMMSTKN